MTPHIVVIARDEYLLERLAAYREPTPEDRADAYSVRIECGVPGGCGMWRECREPHLVDGIGADQHPHEVLPGGAVREFHGEVHEWRDGHGWVIPDCGCPVGAGIDWIDLPDGVDTRRDGRWLVDARWIDPDGDCILELIRETT